MKLISSQKYLNDEIVQTKIDNADFAVSVSPMFIIDGVDYQVILDGHHSYHAAIQAGFEPEFIVQTILENDSIQLLIDDNIEDFLTVNYIDSDYYYVATGISVF